MKKYKDTELSVANNISGRLFEDIREIAEDDLRWDMLSGKTVFITGAGGFIAYYIVTALLFRNDEYDADINVVGMVRNLSRSLEKFGDLLEREDFLLFEQDVCENFDKMLSDRPVDYVIHAASQASNWHFENDPVGTIRANLSGTDNAIRFAKKHGADVLLISSLKVYGEVSDGSQELTEEKQGFVDPVSYKNCYAMGKRAAETLAACYVKQYKMNIKIVRPSYIFGAPSMEDDRVWAQFILNIIRDENILLKSNGAAYRSFCYVTDTVRAILRVMTVGEVLQPYNISTEKGNVTIRGFAKKAVDAFPEKKLTLSFANPEDEAEPVMDYSKKSPEILSSDKLKKLGWNAKVDISEGIKRAVAILDEKW